MSEQRADFWVMLAEAGFQYDWVQRVVLSEADMVPMPAGFEHVQVRDSVLDGKGLFVARGVQAGDLIAPARVAGMRTPAGRFTNHANTPNAEMVLLASGDLDLVATEHIEAGHEVLIDYRQIGAIQGHTFDRERGRAYLRERFGAAPTALQFKPEGGTS